MRISTVIPAYNAAKWLPATLGSVAAQTRVPEEVLVVDDGSSDDTAAIARSFGARVISIPNSGVSAARNLGIAEATGDWIALLDADDIWRADKLRRQVDALALAPDVGLVATDHYQFNDDGSLHLASLLGARRDRYAKIAPRSLAEGVSLLQGMGVGLISLGMALFPSTLLFRRELALADGGFDPDMRYAEDYEFLLRLLTRTDVLMVEDVLMGYRRHVASASGNDEAMAEALVAIGERIEAEPLRYAPGAREAFGPRMREGAMHAAMGAFKRRDLAKSRRMLRAAGRVRRDFKWLSLSIATATPASLIDTLVEMRQIRLRVKPA